MSEAVGRLFPCLCLLHLLREGERRCKALNWPSLAAGPWRSRRSALRPQLRKGQASKVVEWVERVENWDSGSPLKASPALYPLYPLYRFTTLEQQKPAGRLP
jgi:hypothetical protein